MIKFLTLLDQRNWDCHQPKQPFAEQAREAHALFPQMVGRSHLCYWRPGDPVGRSQEWYLLGLAATFSPVDLHLADLLNEALERKQFPGKQVDVFDIADADSWSDLRNYFPDIPGKFLGWGARPILGVWQSGKYMGMLMGHAAINRILQAFDIALTAEQVYARMCPAGDQWYEDVWPEPPW
jgi:hypothetical protein